MELISGSETSATRTLTPGNYPKRNKLHLQHGESLKTTSKHTTEIQNIQQKYKTYNRNTKHTTEIQNTQQKCKTYNRNAKHTTEIQNIQKKYKTYKRNTKHTTEI